MPKLMLTFKLVSARDQTHLPCEFVANQFSASKDLLKTLFFISGDLDLNIQTHPSEGPTKHVFCVNMSQISSRDICQKPRFCL